MPGTDQSNRRPLLATIPDSYPVMTVIPYRTAVITFLTLMLVSLVIWSRPLRGTFHLALTNDAYTHILLIFPLTVALSYLDSRFLRIDPRPSLRLGAMLLLLAFLIFCAATWGLGALQDDKQLSLVMFAFVTWAIASVVFCFGVKVLQCFLFPLCLLYLLVPIPDSFLRGIVEFLQQQSAIAARIMFRAVGVPATRDGIMLSIPGLDIEVARECSSIRSSLILLVLTLVLAHLFLHSWRRKALMIAMVAPLSVAKNGLRIFTIAQLGTRVDEGFLYGRLHHQGGVVFLGISLIAVVVLLWILKRTERSIPLSPVGN